MSDTAANLVVSFYGLMFFIALAFVPPLIARNKGKSFWGVLAFTIIVPFGWFIALIWALCVKRSEPQPQVIIVNAMPGTVPVIQHGGHA